MKSPGCHEPAPPYFRLVEREEENRSGNDIFFTSFWCEEERASIRNENVTCRQQRHTKVGLERGLFRLSFLFFFVVLQSCIRSFFRSSLPYFFFMDVLYISLFLSVEPSVFSSPTLQCPLLSFRARDNSSSSASSSNKKCLSLYSTKKTITIRLALVCPLVLLLHHGEGGKEGEQVTY